MGLCYVSDRNPNRVKERFYESLLATRYFSTVAALII
jgi:hypothetical protein